MTKKIGKTRDAGIYERDHQTIEIAFIAGKGDVVANVNGCRIVVEAKGGCLNTRSAGQLSKLHKHFYESVGMLLDDRISADRRIAALPYHKVTNEIAKRMMQRCQDAGIEIALVSENGDVRLCTEVH